MDKSGENVVLFSAVIRPHRSAGRPAARALAGTVAIALMVISVGFVIAGAWPVLPFFGLEVILLYAGLRFNQRTGNALEAINLTRSAFTVRRVDHWGNQSAFTFQPSWLQVDLCELPGHDNRLELRAHGRTVTIASFLQPHERRELALSLRRELSRLSRPLPSA